MTRVEVSVCPDAFNMYKPLPNIDGSGWRFKVQAFLDLLIANVLNNKMITRHVYHKLSVPLLLTAFSDAKQNILAVGRS